MTASGAWPGANGPAGTSARPGATFVPLSAALRAAALELERQAPPAILSRGLLGAWPQAQGAHAGTSRRGRLSLGLGWAGSAAGALFALLLLSTAATLMLPAPELPRVPVVAVSPPSGFVPVAGAESLRGADAKAMPAWLVSTEMPRERLGLLGLPFDPARAGENVRAELLMHGSGAVLAVRVVAQ